MLTPNNLLRGKPTPVLEKDLMMKLLQRSKEQLRKRILYEYVHALGGRESNTTVDNPKIPDIGAVMFLEIESKDKALLKLGRVVDTIIGKDGVVRGLKLRQGNEYNVERPLQLVCNVERREL